jgi:hypothetical protein
MADKQIAPKDPEGQKKGSSDAAARVEKKSLAARKSRRVKTTHRVKGAH